MDPLQPGCFVLVKNNNRVNKEDPLYKDPFRVLPPRADHSQHMYELESMVEDTCHAVRERGSHTRVICARYGPSCVL